MDRGSILGLGLFETLLAVDGSPVFMDRHLTRFQAACTRLGWQVAMPDLRAIAAELLERTGLAEGRARLRLTLTSGTGSIRDTALGRDSLLWMAAMPAGDAGLPVTANLSPWPRNERSALAGLKCASYAENLLGLDHARREGFDESLFLNSVGELCEAATSNVFLVKQGIVATPSLDSGCLPGVTREVVMELAARCGMPVEERPVAPGELHSADEVFLTSAVRGPVWVSRIGQQPFVRSSITERLKAAWAEEVQRSSRF
jgi:branched-subunit amino acid aminotransferase/4-amino-4-deoxychorismate lyase